MGDNIAVSSLPGSPEHEFLFISRQTMRVPGVGRRELREDAGALRPVRSVADRRVRVRWTGASGRAPGQPLLLPLAGRADGPAVDGVGDRYGLRGVGGHVHSFQDPRALPPDEPELAGGAGAGLIAENLLDGPAQRGVTLGALDSGEPLPGVGPTSSPEADLPPRQPDFGGDLDVAPLLEGQEDDGRSLAELRRGRGGVADRLKDVLLTFGDGDLGRPTRQSESLPGGCEASVLS
jgi:hypothetical protein